MRKTHTVLTVAAAFLASPAERFWGYELSGSTGVRTGTLYPILTRFLNAGWITDGWESSEEKTGAWRPPRRYYTLTPSGRSGMADLVQQARAGERRRRARGSGERVGRTRLRVAGPLVAGAATVALLAGCGAPAATPAVTTPATSIASSATPTGTVPVTPTSPVDHRLASSNPPVYGGSSLPAPPAATGGAAAAFVKILGHTAGVDRTAWTDALTPLCSEGFGDQLALAAPSQIPEQSVTGPAQLVGNSPLLVAAYFVPTSKDGFTVWMDYNTVPGIVTGALPGKHDFDDGAQS